MSMTEPRARARRVTVFRDRTVWRWKAQASNWQLIGTSPKGYRTERAARDAAEKAWPGVPVVVRP